MIEECILEEEVSQNIIELRRVTQNLPQAPLIEFASFMGSVTQTQVEQGANPVIPLHKSTSIAILLAIGAPDTVVTRHSHDQHEWIGVIKGKMIVDFNGGTNTYGQNEVCYIPPKLAHTVTYPEYTEVWVVTQPADPSFPSPVEAIIQPVEDVLPIVKLGKGKND